MPQQAVVPSKRDWGDESDESDYSETGVSVRLLRRERTQIWRHDHSLRPINNKRDLNDTQQSPAARVVENNDRLGETAGDHEGPRHGHRRPSADTQDDINKGNELDELDPYPLNFYPPHDFQVIDLAAKTQIDKTIQFAVDISEDIEGHCEELSRLKRWGYFSMALEYFESNLQQHLDLPMVAIEYADLLSGQGSYRDLTKCRLDAPETMKTIPPSFEPSPNLYKTHFDLLILNAKIAFQSLAPEDLDSYDPVDFLFEISYEANLRLEEKTDSGRDIPFNYTEIQVLRNCLNLGAQMNRKNGSNKCTHYLVHDNWHIIYNDLLVNERIWEFHDFFIAMNRFFGPSKTWKSLFGTASSTRDDNAQLSAVFQKFKQDWDLAEYDESTELALLSILTGQIYEMYYSRRSYYAIKPAVAREIKIFLQQASLHAGRVESHSAHLIKTRPYLQWRILTETINRNLNCYVFQKDRDTEIETMPGNLYDEWPLPIYVPKSTERPHWPKPNPAFPPNESLLWVLKTCRDNGDYKTEASCLYELIARAENPRSYFEELDDLLLQKQGDYRAYLESCISQYHLSTEESSSRRLIQKLKEANVQLASSSEEELDTLRIAGLQIQNALCYQFPELWPDIKQNLKLIGKMVRPELKTNPLDIQGKTGEQVPEHDTGAQRDRDDPIIHKEPGSSGLSFKPKRNGGRSPARTRPNDKSRISKQRGYGEASTEIHKNNTRRRSPSPHSNIELLMSQRILERNDIRQDMDIWKQKQDIERLERKLDRLMGSLHNETTQGPQMEPNMTVAQDNPPGGSGEKNINIRKPDELLEEVGNAQVTEKNTQGLDDQTQIGKEHQPRVSSDQEEPLSTGNGEAENPYSGEEVE